MRRFRTDTIIWLIEGEGEELGSRVLKRGEEIEPQAPTLSEGLETSASVSTSKKGEPSVAREREGGKTLGGDAVSLKQGRGAEGRSRSCSRECLCVRVKPSA